MNEKSLAIGSASFDTVLMTEVVLTIPSDAKGKALLHFLHQIDFIKIQSERN